MNPMDLTLLFINLFLILCWEDLIEQLGQMEK